MESLLSNLPAVIWFALTGNTLVIPANLADLGSLITSAMSVVKASR